MAESDYFPVSQGREESLWDWHSPVHSHSAWVLEQNQSGNLTLSDQEQLAWSLLFECTHYEWYLRPKLYQIQQAVDTYFGIDVVRNDEIFILESWEEKVLKELKNCLDTDKHIDKLLKYLEKVNNSGLFIN